MTFYDANDVVIEVGMRVSTGKDTQGVVTALEDNMDADYDGERYVQCGWPEVYVLGDGEATPERFTCPGRYGVRQIWIAPFVKGPEGAPFKMGKRAWEFSR